MDAGEDLIETLKREMIEEIGNSFISKPVQPMTLLANITIPVVENVRAVNLCGV